MAAALAALLAFVFSLPTGAATRGPAPQTTTVTVSAAISLKDALDQIGPVYEREHRGVKIVFNYGGSGTLQRQIEQGAPVDVFFSASEKQMNALEAEGLLLAGTRGNVLENSLVLIAPAGETGIRDFADLEMRSVQAIALGEPSTVPAGLYARQTLEHLGLFGRVQKKIVYAKDVRAVLTYVETGNADAGFVYLTDAETSSKVRIVARAPENSHDPIVYPAAVVKGSRNPEAARAFLAFLEGEEARAVFAKYGFLAAEIPAAKN